MDYNEDDLIEETVILDESPRLQFYINICLRCDVIVGTSKINYSSKGPYVDWFFSTKNGIPFMCEECNCMICDECKSETKNRCIEECNGKLIPYQMFKET